MSTQLKNLHLGKSKGKSSERTQQDVDELECLVTFNRSVSQAMARTMQNLSERIFMSVANFTLARRQLPGVFTCWCKTGHAHCTVYCSCPFAVTFPEPAY